MSSHSALAQSKAEKQLVQVLTLYSDTAYEQAEALSIALKRAVDRSGGWTLGKGDFSLEVLTAALGCKTTPDEACLQKISERVKSKHFVWGSLEKQGKDVVGTLHLYDGEGGKETQVKYSENLSDASDETLLQIAEVAFADLVGTAPGKLVIVSKQAKTVSVDGAAPTSFVSGRAELTLPGGEHTIVLRAPGFGDESRDITVVQGQSAELEIAMRGTAAAVDGGGEVGFDTGKPMNTKKVIGIAGMGVGAALLVGAVYSAIKVNSINNDDGFDRYRNSVSEGEDVCDSADAGKTFVGAPDPSEISDQCSSASTFQTLQFVFAGAGAVIGGVGAYLFLTADDEPHTASYAPRFDTAVGPRGGRFRVTLSF
ncbi:MAG: hypothetical protein R3B89_15830 [Polyangiaceae bacterium]